MIPSGTSPKVEYTSGGPSFSVAFPTFENADVVVQAIDALDITTLLVEGVDYSLSSIGIPNTYGIMTLTGAGPWHTAGTLTAGYTLRVKYNSEAFQPAKLRDLGRFAPEAIEKSMDRIAMSTLALRQEQVDDAAIVVLLQADVQNLQSDVGLLQTDVADHESRIFTLETTVALSPPVEFQAVNFNAAYNKIYIVTAAVDVQLPAPIANNTIQFKISSSVPVNLLRNAAENIDFISSNKALTSIKEAVTLVSDGIDWFII